EHAAIARQLLDGEPQRLGRQAGVEPLQRRAEPGHEHDLGRGLTPERTVRPERLVEGVDRLPAQLREDGDSRLLDESIFGVIAHVLPMPGHAHARSGAWDPIAGADQLRLSPLIRPAPPYQSP